MNKYIKILRKVLSGISNILAICLVVVAYIHPIYKYSGTELPYIVEVNSIIIIFLFSGLSIFLSIIGFITGRKNKVTLVLLIFLLITNVYKIKEILIINDLIEKGMIPYSY
ncbi:hypothetical protein [Tepidibacter mesophilus]|uniref:hypothetical protein n=1 Tax=Tepidibacter mesophilus TaxID=655607 RepID=UPI000C0873A8|nr:hypothetical protein [Tepidibacter mesophilus]